MTSRPTVSTRPSRQRLSASVRSCIPEALERRTLFAVTVPTLVTVGVGGVAANGDSGESSVSANGRYVVFSSVATNLVDGDTNGKKDIFLRDTVNNTTIAISRNPTTNDFGNGDSNQPIINQDGTFVAFVSRASNLVDGDTLGHADIFRYNIATGAIQLASAANTAGTTFSSSGSSEPTISKDGNLVSFTSFATNFPGSVDGNSENDVYVRNMGSTAVFGIAAGATKTVSVKKNTTNISGNNMSFDSWISADGRYITFRSDASDLVDGDTNGQRDTFLRDLQNGTTVIISVTTAGVSGNAASDSNSVSGDGRYVAFQSRASDLVANDNNLNADIFLRDTLTNRTTLLTVNKLGTASAAGFSQFPALSQNGAYATFSSTAADIVSGDANAREDVFIRDLARGPLSLVSVNTALQPSNGISKDPFINQDGNFVSFTSTATDISAVASGGKANIFLATTPPPTTTTDTAAPTATFGVLEAANATDTSAKFTVNLADGVALNTVTVGNVTVTKSDNTTGTVTLVSVVGTGTSAVATYSVSFGGTTLDQNTGTYTVSIGADTIQDAAGNFAAAGNIGTFTLSSTSGSGGGTSGGGGGGGTGGTDGGGGTATLGDPNGPNLIISKIGNAPSKIVSGVTKGKLKFTVKNLNGPGIVNKVNTLFGVYLSADGAVDTSDTLLTTTTAKKLSLKVNKSKSLSAKWTFPTGVGDGNYFIIVKADSGSVIAESSETDNTLATTSTVLVQAPFFDLNPVSVAKVSGTIAGKNSSIKVTIQNLGNVTFKGTVPVQIVATGSGVPIDSTATEIITLSSNLNLGAGKKKAVTLKFTFPTLAAGTYQAGIVVDSTNVVAESDESNNSIQTIAFSV